MVTIKKLLLPENQTLFDRHPELNKIWEVTALQHQARESYEQWGVKEYEGESLGEIFSIDEDDMPIGIIGWFEYGEFTDVLRLRYYGIVPSRRGKRYGEEAMRLFLEHLSCSAPKQYVYLAESVTLGRPKSKRIIEHFKSMGFVEFDDPHYGENAGCGETLSLRVRIPGR
ncbi:MAG: hypothetical protein RLZZ347_210 [Candidatus Parcubacteria bacterium]|jgi:hypothetical protein